MNAPHPRFFLFNLFVIVIALTLGISRAEAVVNSVAASDGTFNYKVEVTWSGGTSVNTTSKVWRAQSLDGDRTYIGNGDVSKTGNGSYDDSDALPEVTYFYWVEECITSTMICDTPVGGDDGFRLVDIPAGLSATQGSFNDKIVVSWSAVTGTTPLDVGYRVYRASSEGGLASHLGLIENTSYEDLAAPNSGHGYYYSVKACAIGGGCGEPSGSTVGWKALAAPASVTATDGTSTTAVTVSWPAVAGAAGYEIWRRTSAAPSLFATISSPTPIPLGDSVIGAGVDAHYKVRAFSYPYDPNVKVPGAFSSEDTGWKAYTVPSLVEATYKTDVDKVVVSWSAVSNAERYQVYRSETSDGAQTEIGFKTFAEPDPTEFNDTTATPGVPYYYRVAACIGPDYHCSEKGGPAIGVRRLAATASFAASDGATDLHVILSWTAVNGAHSYNIFRKEGDGVFAYLDYVSDTSFNDATAFPGRLYSYYVQAFTSWSEHASVGDAGPTDTGFRQAASPANLAASDGTYSDKVRINWTPSTGDNLTYEVYRKVKDEIGSSVTLAVDLTGPPFDDASTVSGVEYEYFVFACVSPDGGSTCLGSLDFGWAASACNINMIPGGAESVDSTHEACEMLAFGPDFIAASGTSVSANSGWEIEFLSGFLVEQGATMEANVCGQSLCLTSPHPMPDGCHSCVDQICDSDSECCSTAFDQDCLDMVYSVCGLVCDTD